VSKATVHIIGGGLPGLATAYALAARDIPVVLLEAEATLGSQTSFANGAMLTTSMSAPWNSPGVWRHLAGSLFGIDAGLRLRPAQIAALVPWGCRFLRGASSGHYRLAFSANFALCRFSMEVLDAWRQRVAPDLGIRADGALMVFPSVAAMRQTLCEFAEHGPADLAATPLERDELLTLAPQLRRSSTSAAAGIFFPDDRSGDPQVFVAAFADEARRLGADIRCGVRVTALHQRSGRIVGIVTDSGPLACDHVIVAAGCHTLALARTAGVAVPIAPAKGYSLTFRVPEPGLLPPMPIVDHALHVGVVPLSDRVRVVGAAEFAGFDLRIPGGVVTGLRGSLAKMLPDLANSLGSLTSPAWAGLRPMSADGMPFIGEAQVKGLWMNSGHGHLGWTMAAGSAELIAQLLTGEVPSIDPLPFRVGR
jgi:D-amino-acid dehydrogenase